MTGMNRRDLMMMGGSMALLALAANGGPALAQAAKGAKGVDIEGLGFVDPELREAARNIMEMDGSRPPMSDEVIKAMRQNSPPDQKPLPGVPVEAREVPVPGGPNVTVYVINARPGKTPRPGILHMHGGGYILGAAKMELPYYQAMAKELDCIIVSVEYRLAPETTYVGSVEDNYAGLKWMHRNASELGLDPDRIAVLGESAGGGHAARLAITARDRGEVPIVLQSLIYPMLDDRTGSTRQPPAPIGVVGWNAQANQYGWKAFLGQQPGTSDVPSAGVPARVEDLSGLPPAFIAVGAIDLFVHEDIEYANRLIGDLVPTELLVVPGAFHGFDRVAMDTYPARMFTKAKLNALRRAFGDKVKA